MSLEISYLTGSVRKIIKSEGIGGLIARGASGSLLVMVISTLIIFVVQSMLARLIGVSQYGIYVYALTWIEILSLISMLGFNQGLVRFVAAYNINEQWDLFRGIFKRSMQYGLLTSFVVGINASFTVWLLQSEMDSELVTTLWVAFILLPITVMINLRQAVLRALKYVVRAIAFDAILRPFLFGLAVLSYYFFWGYEKISAKEAMLINVVTAVVIFFIGTMLLVRILPSPLKSVQATYKDREWIKVCLTMLFVAGVYLILRRTDILMLGIMVGTDESGIYSVSSRLAELVAFGVVAVESIAAPIISELHSTNQHKRLQKMITIATRGMSGFTFLAGIGMIVIGSELLGLFGEEFVGGYVPLLVLILGRLVITVLGPVGFLMSMTGHHMQMALVTIMAALLNIIMNGVLIPWLGMVGAALSTSLTMIAWATAMLFAVRRNLEINPTVFAVSIV